MGAFYTQLLSDVRGLQLPLVRTDYADNIYWVFGLVISDDIEMTAEEAMKRLAAKSIGCRPFFYPMHQQPVLRNLGLFADEKLPVSERLYQKGFYIPSGMALTEEQMNSVAQAVKEVFA